MAIMKDLKKAVGIEEKPKTALEEMEDQCCEMCPKLSYKQRLMGYATCFGLAFILSMGSWIRLADLVKGKPTPFVVFYTLGNILGIIGSLFLSGPAKQCRAMFDKTRICATLMYFLSIIMTIFCCYYKGIPAESRLGIIILCIIVQWTAMVWYTISFIPFARDYVCMVCKNGPKDCCKGAGSK